MDCLDFLFSDETPVPSPCFVLDEARLAANAAILDEVRREDSAGPQGVCGLGYLSAALAHGNGTSLGRLRQLRGRGAPGAGGVRR